MIINAALNAEQLILKLKCILLHLYHLQCNILITLCVHLQIEKGKLHGCIDVGLSVMAIKKKAKCIDLDAEENIYHLKVNRKACEYKAFPTDLQEVR